MARPDLLKKRTVPGPGGMSLQCRHPQIYQKYCGVSQAYKYFQFLSHNAPPTFRLAQMLQ
jgi:hypothetical protein